MSQNLRRQPARRLWSTGTALVAALLASCATATTDQLVETNAASQISLSGTSWTLTFGSGPQGDIAQVDGFPITLNFDGNTIGGSAACNGYGGTYSIDASQLSIDGLGWSEMGCAPGVQAAEQVFLDALADVDSIEATPGTGLVLSGDSSELIFEANMPVPTTGLVGQLWLLDTLIDGEAASTVAGDPATLRLDEDGTVSGSTGCRSLIGRYVITGDQFQLTDLATDGSCPDALFGQDSHVISVIESGFEADVIDNRLTLTAQGNVGLSYLAIDQNDLEAAVPTPVPSDAEVLNGIEWTFSGGDSPSGPITDPRSIDPEQPITLIFDSDGFGGTAICNGYGGSAIVSNGSLAIDTVESEEEGCGDQEDVIAANYYAALEAMTEFGLEGGSGDTATRLVMNGTDVELQFERSTS